MCEGFAFNKAGINTNRNRSLRNVMKILIISYPTAFQNPAGGIQARIGYIYNCLKKQVDKVVLFNPWEHKIKDFDAVLIFKLDLSTYKLIDYCNSLGVPVIVSPVLTRERPLKTYLNLLAAQLFKLHTGYYFLKQSLNMASRIICQSEEESNFITRVYKINKNQLVVIPNGADGRFLSGDSKLLKDMYGIKADYVLSVGRFDKNKNQLSIIKAIHGTGIPAFFIGGPAPEDVSYYNRCVEIARNIPNIFFLGWVEHDSPILSSAYAGAKVFVLASFYETFGSVLVEAGVAGCNIVSSHTKHIISPEISSNIFSISPKSVRDIKKKIIMAYSTPRNPVLAEYFIRNYSWEKITRRYLDVIEEATNEGRTGKNTG